MNFSEISVEHIPKIGEKRAQILQKELGIRTFGDLLRYYPYRYIDRRRVYKIGELNARMQEVQILAVVQSVFVEGSGKKQRLKAVCSDGTGSVVLVWFKGIDYTYHRLDPGAQYLFFGKPTVYQGSYTFTHPEIETPDRVETVTDSLRPVYHTTEVMKKRYLLSKQLEESVRYVLSHYSYQVPETIPQELRDRLKLMPLQLALQQIHLPKDNDALAQAQWRLKFDELLLLQLYMRRAAALRKTQFAGFLFPKVGALFNAFYHALPFPLTEAQKRVIRQMRADTASGKQMNRLLQGDVGSGKTLVALMMMLLCVDNGHQACIMAPTELLAQQHYQTIKEFLGTLPVQLTLLTGSTTARQRRPILENLSNGTTQIIVGTHALLEENVLFASLGLAVIDEQHRFGVMQRAKLWSKNLATLPHILIMSATPIPRTLAMTLYGDLDVSVIDELPPGRKPIITRHITQDHLDQVMDFVHQIISQGHQVYAVYPMIEGNEESEYKNVMLGYDEFCREFGEEKVTFVHGRLPNEEKQNKMDLFLRNRVPILLSTTVIEVGVNVPNATLMIIFDAHRFGLSQLHQLRGRVGRGADKSYCILVTPELHNEVSERRLEVMTGTQDGFLIAEEDMRLRGFGDLDGVRQSGDLPGLNLADPLQDASLVRLTYKIAGQILSTDPNLSLPQNECLLQGIRALKGSGPELGKIS